MGNFKRSILIAITLFAASFCFAKQITLQIVQHDELSDKVFESSMVVEDELLNGFFDNGFIVTNSPASVSASSLQDVNLFNTGIGDAYEGSSEYFLQIKLYYNAAQSSEKSDLIEVDWTLASAITGITIKENTIKNKYSDTKDLKVLSANLVKEITKAIKA